MPAEKVDAVGGRSRFPFGKTREIVSVKFGLYDLAVYSSNEAPPLGKIVATGPDGRIEVQSLDPLAWREVAEFIMQNEEILPHV